MQPRRMAFSYGRKMLKPNWSRRKFDSKDPRSAGCLCSVQPISLAGMGYLTVCGVSICLCLVLNSANVSAQADRLPIKRQTTDITAEARRLLEGGKADAAIELLNSAPKAASADPQVSRLLGLAYYQKRDYVRAVDSLSSGLKGITKGADDYRQAVQILGLSHYLL